MIFSSDLADTLKTAEGDYITITIMPEKTYYGEVKLVKKDYLTLDLKLRGGKDKTSVLIPFKYIISIEF